MSLLGDATGDVMSTGPREELRFFDFCIIGGNPCHFFPFLNSMWPFSAIKKITPLIILCKIVVLMWMLIDANIFFSISHFYIVRFIWSYICLIENFDISKIGTKFIMIIIITLKFQQCVAMNQLTYRNLLQFSFFLFAFEWGVMLWQTALLRIIVT